MQLDAREYLKLARGAGQVAYFDIEATGLRGDYNSILVVSIKPEGKRPKSFAVERPGQDRSVVRAARDELEKYPLWVSYYGKMFDVPMIQSRLLTWNQRPLEKRHHLDLYFNIVRSRINPAKKSLAHILRWLYPKGNKKAERKFDMSPDEWNRVLRDPVGAIPNIVRRCERDVENLERLLDRTEQLVVNITK